MLVALVCRVAHLPAPLVRDPQRKTIEIIQTILRSRSKSLRADRNAFHHECWDKASTNDLPSVTHRTMAHRARPFEIAAAAGIGPPQPLPQGLIPKRKLIHCAALFGWVPQPQREVHSVFANRRASAGRYTGH